MNDEKILDPLVAVRKKIEEREAKLYKQKQRLIREIFKRAKKEDWIGEISESKMGKRFLLELAIKSCDVSLSRLLPEKFESSHNISVDPLLLEIRKALLEEDKKETDKNES